MTCFKFPLNIEFPYFNTRQQKPKFSKKEGKDTCSLLALKDAYENILIPSKFLMLSKKFASLRSEIIHLLKIISSLTVKVKEKKKKRHYLQFRK